MREIVNFKGETYCYVTVEDGKLLFKLNSGDHKGMTIQFDARIIPQLRQILAEAEFFNYV